MDKNKDITILTIDDDKDILFALGAIIKNQGWNFLSAETVDEGLDLLRKHKPTIVIIDYRMPGKNGIIGVKKIREYSSIIPILVLTIDENQEIADKFMELGANDFAIKPIKAPDLISRIRLHLTLIDNIETTIENNILSRIYPLEKQISENTIKILLKCLCDNSEEYSTVEDISTYSGLSTQTTYRYLQFMEEKDILEIKFVYGKVGRPKQLYKIKN